MPETDPPGELENPTSAHGAGGGELGAGNASALGGPLQLDQRHSFDIRLPGRVKGQACSLQSQTAQVYVPFLVAG